MRNLLKSFVRHGKAVAWLLKSWIIVVRKTWFSPVVRCRVICALRRSKLDLNAVSSDLTDGVLMRQEQESAEPITLPC